MGSFLSVLGWFLCNCGICVCAATSVICREIGGGWLFGWGLLTILWSDFTYRSFSDRLYCFQQGSHRTIFSSWFLEFELENTLWISDWENFVEVTETFWHRVLLLLELIEEVKELLTIIGVNELGFFGVNFFLHDKLINDLLNVSWFLVQEREINRLQSESILSGLLLSCILF